MNSIFTFCYLTLIICLLTSLIFLVPSFYIIILIILVAPDLASKSRPLNSHDLVVRHTISTLISRLLVNLTIVKNTINVRSIY